jgi:hypothetical protein
MSDIWAVLRFVFPSIWMGLRDGGEGGERWVANFGPSAGGWTSYDTYLRTLGDANGDGRADLVGFAPDGTYVATFDRQTRFLYDGAGERVMRIVSDTGGITRTVYAGDWYEYSNDGTTRRR